MAEEAPQTQDEISQQEDVEMGDAEPLKSAFNGPTDTDGPLPTQSPAYTPGFAIGGSSITAVDSVHVRDVYSTEGDAPPAKRARKFSDADQASAHQTVAHVSSLCLVRLRRRANIVVFSIRSCKDFPCGWSGNVPRKWRVASIDSQCIAAQVCSVYDTNSQKVEGCNTIPRTC
jgi:hypothetical protein